MALMVYLSGYLIDRFGVTPVQISWLFVVAGVAAVTGQPDLGLGGGSLDQAKGVSVWPTWPSSSPFRA